MYTLQVLIGGCCPVFERPKSSLAAFQAWQASDFNKLLNPMGWAKSSDVHLWLRESVHLAGKVLAGYMT